MAYSRVSSSEDAGRNIVVRRQEVAGLILTEYYYSDEVLEPTHSHERAYFQILLKGSYTEQEKRRTLEHRSLSLAFQPIVESQASHIHPEGLHCLKMEMSNAWRERIGDGLDSHYSRCLGLPANFAKGSLPWLGVRLFDEW
jgi:hypothetical protein